MLLFRVVNSRSWCVVKPVTTTKRVRNAGTWQHRSRRPPMHPRCGVGVHENGCDRSGGTSRADVLVARGAVPLPERGTLRLLGLSLCVGFGGAEKMPPM